MLRHANKVSIGWQTVECLLSDCITVLDIARALDKERKDGHVRSQLHGLPFLVKWVAYGPQAGLWVHD